VGARARARAPGAGRGSARGRTRAAHGFRPATGAAARGHARRSRLAAGRGRLPCPRADRGTTAHSQHGRVRPRLPPLRVPHRPAAVHGRHARGSPGSASGRAATGCDREPPRAAGRARPGARAGVGESARGAPPDLRRARRRRPARARPRRETARAGPEDERHPPPLPRPAPTRTRGRSKRRTWIRRDRPRRSARRPPSRRDLLTGREARDLRSPTPPQAQAETPDQGAPQEEQGAAEPSTEGGTPAEPAGDSSPTENALSGEGRVGIDANTGEILDTVPIPEPEVLAADGRSVWALGSQGLTRVDAATGAGTSILNPLGRDALAVAGGAAWLSDWEYGRLSRLAPGEPAAEVDFGRGGFYGPVAAAGSLWGTAYLSGNPSFGGRTVLLRVDPVTQQVQARITGVGQVVAAGKGFLWGVPGRATCASTRRRTQPRRSARCGWIGGNSPRPRTEPCGRHLGTAASFGSTP
jgi:hypothetical protein